MKKYLTRNGRLVLRPNNTGLYRNYNPPTPPTPPIVDDLVFLYLANDFDGTKIPNRTTSGLMGDYLEYGTITKNGSGSDCYLDAGLTSSNYLYTPISTTVRDLMRAFNNTFTYYIRMYNRTRWNRWHYFLEK